MAALTGNANPIFALLSPAETRQRRELKAFITGNAGGIFYATMNGNTFTIEANRTQTSLGNSVVISYVMFYI